MADEERVWSGEAADLLDAAGVPRPDGSALGDALHVLGVLRDQDDERPVMTATQDIYGPDVATGISLGDLRELVEMAQLAHGIAPFLRSIAALQGRRP